MANIIKARARYIASTGHFENNTFHNIQIKQEEWKVKVRIEGKPETATLYNDLEDFLNHWDICAKLNPL